MARRNYKARLSWRGVRGLPRSPARAHTEVRTAKARPPSNDPRIEAALLEMNRGRSMTAAARAVHISRPRLRELLVRRRLVKRKGRRWLPKDNRPRRIQVMTRGRPRNLIVADYQEASLVGQHHNAVKAFVHSNNRELLLAFEGRSVRAANNRRYLLETDPNALHRIAAMDSPPFHEIYEIISDT